MSRSNVTFQTPHPIQVGVNAGVMAGGALLSEAVDRAARRGSARSVSKVLRQDQRLGIIDLQDHTGQTHWTWTAQGRLAALRGSVQAIPAAVVDRGLHATLLWIHDHSPRWYQSLTLRLAASAVALMVPRVTVQGEPFPVSLPLTAMYTSAIMLIGRAMAESGAETKDQEWDSTKTGQDLPDPLELPLGRPDLLRRQWLERFPDTLELLLTDPITGQARSRDQVLALARSSRTLVQGGR